MLEQYDLHNLMVIDIETVPQYSSFDQVPEHFQKLWGLKTQYQRKEETPEEFYERGGNMGRVRQDYLYFCRDIY